MTAPAQASTYTNRTRHFSLEHYDYYCETHPSGVVVAFIAFCHPEYNINFNVVIATKNLTDEDASTLLTIANEGLSKIEQSLPEVNLMRSPSTLDVNRRMGADYVVNWTPSGGDVLWLRQAYVASAALDLVWILSFTCPYPCNYEPPFGDDVLATFTILDEFPPPPPPPPPPAPGPISDETGVLVLLGVGFAVVGLSPVVLYFVVAWRHRRRRRAQRR